MSQPFQALNPPPAASERGGVEVLRSAIIDGELHVTLRPLFNDPKDWGRLFATVARQVAEAYAQQNRFQKDDSLARISATFEADMKSPPDVASAIAPTS